MKDLKKTADSKVRRFNELVAEGKRQQKIIQEKQSLIEQLQEEMKKEKQLAGKVQKIN